MKTASHIRPIRDAAARIMASDFQRARAQKWPGVVACVFAVAMAAIIVFV